MSIPIAPFWGVNGHFTWNNSAGYVPAKWAGNAASMKDLGMLTYRNGYGASNSSSTGAVTSSDGATFRNFINNTATPNGIVVAPVLLPLYQTSWTGGTATEATAYTLGYNLGVDAATNLAGLVPWYEVGNEFDGGQWSDGNIVGGTGRGNVTSDFNNAKFLICRGSIRGMIAGIRSVDTTTPIMQPGGTWLHTAFFDMLRNGSTPSAPTTYDATKIVDWDLSSWHWYLNNYGPNDDIENPTDQGGFNVLAHIAGWGKPIYITECGANAMNGTTAVYANEAAIASAIVGSYLLARFVSVRNTYNIKGVQYYQLVDAAGNSASVSPTDNEMMFGLVASDGTTQKGRYPTVKNFIAANPVTTGITLMASNLKYSANLKNAQQNAITTTVGASALLNLYSGTQPASPDTAITSQVLLATLTCNATFAPSASGGVLTLNSIANGTGLAAAGTGTNATWFRITTSGGTAHIDGTVSTSGSDLNLTNTSIAQNQTISVSSFTFTNGN
ncbi:hypothetical protein [Caballeronia sp. LZ035]|uniref:hypothetical protein n=1 Tax=Caballeronia sp. LZ035 TaxID=3038568 RepID=UPI002857A118|nr:hypothetical protein [Caballeronia sp. LZ035]MDR5757043.1 hypothetical protein [Caballeronia sp. LZ035]